MQSGTVRSGLLAAVSICAFAIAFAPAAHAQQAAAPSAANPELAAKGAWDETVTYAKDDIVIERGSAWISLRANNKNRVPGQTQPSTAIYWQLFARGFNPLGAWSNATKYQPDDLVTRSGQTWRAKRTVAAGGVPPAAGANWELLAAKGAEGAQGEQGPAGPNTGIGMGSQNGPSISFNGDPNTGIFSPSNGRIALVEDGMLVLHNTGTTNTALGRNAMGENADVGFGNTALGAAALFAVTSTGFDNTAVGHSALVANTEGGNNTAIGKNALSSNVTGSNNTAVGRDALKLGTSVANSAVGSSALAANTTGSGNVAVGYLALTANTEGFANVAIGLAALTNATTGSFNTAVGQSALSFTTTGADSTAVGGHALLFSTASYNTAVGRSALRSSTTGEFNTAFGNDALYSNLTGDGNIALGVNALYNNTTGAENIAIGRNAGLTPAEASNSIFIGNIGAANDDAVIRIGTQTVQTTAFMAGITGVTVANEAAVAINTSTGQLGVVSSSRRYKEDIVPMGDVNATLMKLRPVTFHYTAAHDDGRRRLQYGLIAEEVAESVPDLAAYNAQGTPETVKYHLLPSFLLAGYQAQQSTIAALSERDRRQSEKVEALEERLRRLEALLPPTRAASIQ